MDLIDRNEAAKIVRRIAGYYSPEYAEIQNLPAVDAAPVVHGRWELHGNDDDVGSSYWCSVCHKQHDEEWSDGKWAFCPFCGAKMDL